jgi:hypothetical protein
MTIGPIVGGADEVSARSRVTGFMLFEYGMSA